MSIVCKASHAVYQDPNGHTLTPYVNDKGEIWLASEGNGGGNDVMVEDVDAWAAEEIVETYAGLNVDAMRAAAMEFLMDGCTDAANWLENWCDTVARAREASVEE